MIIAHGIRPEHLGQAASLYWEAFGSKLGIVMGPRAKALGFIGHVMDPDHALSATDEAGHLLGVVGFKTAKGALVGGTFADLRRTYGLFGASWRAAILSLLERDTENTRFLMDGIFVAPAARGKGVGTALLCAVTHEAKSRGYAQLRLDVIDTNPRARALYERQGFTPVKTANLGPLRHIFGFRSATTMVRTTSPVSL